MGYEVTTFKVTWGLPPKARLRLKSNGNADIQKVNAIVASLIATCKINSVEPYAWMKATLKAIATGHPQSRIDKLLPWSFGRTS
ncbi:transposase domain-containing protein [Bradyrhizobium sp. 195]|uniref:transposase domain-containing protein n=1 Tax=Bradyrhizobium sp. 195 TaxID=2782662 RepID=UPI002001B0A3|nr:transposase domain-containing protein [Bradyrhizobium sp. 195]